MVGLPLEWILGHLKDNHGIHTTLENVFDYLNIQIPSKSFLEVQEWLTTTQILNKAIDGIPIDDGFYCNICNYSSKVLKVLKNHFNSYHYNEKWSNWTEECKVQRPVKGQFHKYVQVRTKENLDSESHERNWMSTLKDDFNKVLNIDRDGEREELTDLRLMDAFIAKTRWDLAFSDVNGKTLIDLAAIPTVKDGLYKILVCARKYIKDCCLRLSKGNMIVRRRLMCARYNIVLYIF